MGEIRRWLSLSGSSLEPAALKQQDLMNNSPVFLKNSFWSSWQRSLHSTTRQNTWQANRILLQCRQRRGTSLQTHLSSSRPDVAKRSASQRSLVRILALAWMFVFARGLSRKKNRDFHQDRHRILGDDNPNLISYSADYQLVVVIINPCNLSQLFRW